MGRRKKSADLPEYKMTDVLVLDDIYVIINYVQVQRKECSFTASTVDAPTINNVLRDLEIPYLSEKSGGNIKYSLCPPEERKYSDETFIFEELPDELPDENDCFED